MSDRIAIAALSLLSFLSLFVAPWAAISRQTGARSSVLLLPNTFIDFSGRTDPVAIQGLGIVFVLSLSLLAVLLLSSFLKQRYLIWLTAGLVLVATTAWGLNNVQSSVRDVRLGLIDEAITEALADPSDRIDIAALEEVQARASERPVDMTLLRSRQAGFTIRRLAYPNSGLSLAAFLALVTGGLAAFFGLKTFKGMSRIIERILTVVAVPAVAIFLSLLVAAVVILTLEATPVGRDIQIEGTRMWLAGRLETLWYAYMTLFANSLGTVGGFAESLKFATPLIFTGLAVAFGFQAGLFNIGAPGQMVLGAIGAMLVGLYMPGPRFIVLPLAVLGAAVGGGIWGGIPGWLKARFGANEVINTILMNYIASSILLFILSDTLNFSVSALWAIGFLGALLVLLVLLTLIAPVRRTFAKAPRLVSAGVGVTALLGILLIGALTSGSGFRELRMPFKVPGSEPKSYPLQEEARLQKLPDLLGVNEGTVGDAVLSLNLALIAALLGTILVFFLLPRFRRLNLWQRLLGSLVGGAVLYGIGAVAGLSRREVIIPPTNLNTSFLIAIGAAVFMYYFMWRTKWGYELRAVGVAPKAAEYGGADISRNTILAMTLSGAFAGLTACHYVLGGALEEYSLRQAIPTNDGFDGIAVALLGNNTPVGVVLSAFLFGVLKNGGTRLDVTFSALTRDVVSMIVALVVLFIAAKGFLPDSVTDPVRRRLGLAKEEDA